MAESLAPRKSNAGRSKLRTLEASDLMDVRGDGFAYDATYGDTLRKLMPRRLSSLTRSRTRD